MTLLRASSTDARASNRQPPETHADCPGAMHETPTAAGIAAMTSESRMLLTGRIAGPLWIVIGKCTQSQSDRPVVTTQRASSSCSWTWPLIVERPPRHRSRLPTFDGSRCPHAQPAAPKSTQIAPSSETQRKNGFVDAEMSCVNISTNDSIEFGRSSDIATPLPHYCRHVIGMSMRAIRNHDMLIHRGQEFADEFLKTPAGGRSPSGASLNSRGIAFCTTTHTTMECTEPYRFAWGYRW